MLDLRCSRNLNSIQLIFKQCCFVFKFFCANPLEIKKYVQRKHYPLGTEYNNNEQIADRVLFNLFKRSNYKCNTSHAP